MKKTIVTAVLLISIGANAYAADAINVNKNISKEKAQFEVTSNALNQKIESPLNHEELVSKELLNKEINQLPIKGKKAFIKMFDGYQIKQVIRSFSEEEIFLITAENDQEKVVFKIDSQLNLSILKTGKN